MGGCQKSVAEWFESFEERVVEEAEELLAEGREKRERVAEEGVARSLGDLWGGGVSRKGSPYLVFVLVVGEGWGERLEEGRRFVSERGKGDMVVLMIVEEECEEFRRERP